MPASAWDVGSIPGSGRASEEGNGNPLQYSCLENSMDRGAWQLQSTGSQRVGHDWTSKQQEYGTDIAVSFIGTEHGKMLFWISLIFPFFLATDIFDKKICHIEWNEILSFQRTC